MTSALYLETHVCIHHCESGEVTKLNLSVKKTDFIPRTRRRVQLCIFMFMFCMYVLKNVTSCSVATILIDAA